MDNENRDLSAIHPNMKKVVSLESFVFIGLFIAFFGWIGSQMGVVNMLNTMMNTAFDLLINTCFSLVKRRDNT